MRGKGMDIEYQQKTLYLGKKLPIRHRAEGEWVGSRNKALHVVGDKRKNPPSKFLMCERRENMMRRFVGAQKSGHVPSVINLEWKSALKKDGSLKNAPDLQKIYSSLDKRSKVITYCQSGY